MSPKSGARRTRAIAAGVVTGARRILLVACLVVLALPAARCIASLYVRGMPTPMPVAGPPADYRALAVRDASVAEAQAVRAAAASLRYPVDARELDVALIESSETANVRQAAEYLGDGTIRLRRDVVQIGGSALSWSLAHEIGHYVDETYMRDDSRAEFMRMRAIPEHLQWDDLGASWDRRPAEDFADTFAARAQDPPADRTTTRYGRIAEPGAFEHLLAECGLAPGRPPPEEAPGRTAMRDAALYLDFLAQPAVALPLAAAAVVYVVAGAVRRGRRTWWRLAA